jgi:hypothetical protein
VNRHQGHRSDRGPSLSRPLDAAATPGKRTLTQAIDFGVSASVARPVQRKPNEQSAAEPGAVAHGSDRVLGELPGGLRETMERSFGADFSAVRVHEGPESAAMGAEAFARGADIHFAPGRYDPSSVRGRELIGHELAHVEQQRAGRVSAPQGKSPPINTDPALEAEADAAGTRAARGETASMAGGSGAVAADGPVQLHATGGSHVKYDASRVYANETTWAEATVNGEPLFEAEIKNEVDNHAEIQIAAAFREKFKARALANPPAVLSIRINRCPCANCVQALLDLQTEVPGLLIRIKAAGITKEGEAGLEYLKEQDTQGVQLRYWSQAEVEAKFHAHAGATKRYWTNWFKRNIRNQFKVRAVIKKFKDTLYSRADNRIGGKKLDVYLAGQCSNLNTVKRYLKCLYFAHHPEAVNEAMTDAYGEDVSGSWDDRSLTRADMEQRWSWIATLCLETYDRFAQMKSDDDRAAVRRMVTVGKFSEIDTIDSNARHVIRNVLFKEHLIMQDNETIKVFRDESEDMD